MRISIPREPRGERRVALSPAAVAHLAARGHALIVEAGAGEGAGHRDDDYERAGASLVWSHEEAFGRGDLVLRVSRPSVGEIALLPEGGTIAAFLHLVAAPREEVAALASRRATALALEDLEVAGERPVQIAMSEIAGRLCPQIASRWLETTSGGRGVLLSGIPGVPPAEVVVLGAGTVGTNAARAFASLGARVTLLDSDLRRLRALEAALRGPALVHASEATIARSVAYADVLVACVLVRGERAPVLVRAKHLETMRTGAVVIDLSVDEGGSVETTRPTTLEDPVFRSHGVISFCVPNAPALVARTASHALSQALVSILSEVRGDLSAALASAVALDKGVPRRESVARLLGGGT